jgi:hypothetical protein
MRILVACEFSGVVRDAFARRGHFAVSCDLLPSRSNPGYHYRGDVRDILDDGWDMGIYHPPCTYLASSSAGWMNNPERQERIREALEFVRVLMNAPIYYGCLENPVGIISTRIRKPDQMIHPWQFGETEQKKTHLWLKNLPLLKPTKYVPKRLQTRRLDNVDRVDRGLKRSVFWPGVAEAMADQWSNLP